MRTGLRRAEGVASLCAVASATGPQICAQSSYLFALVVAELAVRWRGYDCRKTFPPNAPPNANRSQNLCASLIYGSPISLKYAPKPPIGPENRKRTL